MNQRYLQIMRDARRQRRREQLLDIACGIAVGLLFALPILEGFHLWRP